MLLLSWTDGININEMKFTMVEYFAGAGAVSRAFTSDPHHRAASYEIRDSSSMDFLSEGGFLFLSCCEHSKSSNGDWFKTMSHHISQSWQLQGWQSSLHCKAVPALCISWRRSALPGHEFPEGVHGERPLIGLVT